MFSVSYVNIHVGEIQKEDFLSHTHFQLFPTIHTSSHLTSPSFSWPQRIN